MGLLRMKILLTGGAGFIGMHVSRNLAELGYEVFIIDNLNDYYSPQLKVDRLGQLGVELHDGLSVEVSSFYPNLSFCSPK